MDRRIAILSDIHGNVPALQAVLADLRDQEPDEVLVGGDLVGRGPEGDAVVREVMTSGWSTIRGNHEDYLLNFARRTVDPAWMHAEEWAASRWMAAELSPDALRWIGQLPYHARPTLTSDLHLVHGSPRGTTDGLGPWTPDEVLDAHLEPLKVPYLVCGHTHRSMTRTVPSGTVVNSGSVGLPFNGDPRAQYVVFTSHRGVWQVEHRALSYDIGETLQRYARTGFQQHGGATAELLALELRHARSFLVPFIAWCQQRQVAPLPRWIDPWLRAEEAEGIVRVLAVPGGAE
jgi:predicted phosphodiesterase